MVLKFQRSQVTDVVEKKNQEPLTYQFVNAEPELNCMSC